MAFPNDPLDVTFELYVDGSWVDITTDVLVRDGAIITRGRSDEGTRTDPSKCRFSIQNAHGKYSPRNPMSPYYMKIGRNTPVRVSVGGDIRFVGEISSWPPKWDVSGKDVWVPVEASGILRRLSQGSAVIGSPMYRGRVFDTEGLIAYWPFEDEAGAEVIAPALDHGPMSFVGSPRLAAYSGFASSKPIAILNDAEFRGSAPSYSPTGETQVRFLMNVPQAGAEDGQTLFMFYATGTAKRWEFFYQGGGLIGLRVFDGNGNQIHTTGPIAFGVNGKKLMVSIELTQTGSNVGWTISTLEPGAPSGLTLSDTFNNCTVARIGTIVVSPSGGVANVAIGHVSVQNVITTLFDLGAQLASFDGEPAGRRIARLCNEEGIAFTGVGDLDRTARLGIQESDTILNLISDAAEADMGILYEPREILGLAYRTRESLYRQSSAVELDYAAGHLAPPLEPVDDDQNIRNDITVTRVGGSSARSVVESGPLSVSDPPVGVGRYDEEITLNVRSDGELPNQAGWRVHLGTVDEARYPHISVNLASPDVVADIDLTADVVGVDIGDRLTIDNPPSWLPTNQISQLVYGFSEYLGAFDWDVTVNCVPETPWRTAEYGTSRYGTAYSTLAAPINATTTSLSVTTSTGPRWTTAPGDFPLDIEIGGERMTVTSITGTGTTQTFTVIRSVNGVTKSHASGSAVKLFDPSIRAL